MAEMNLKLTVDLNEFETAVNYTLKRLEEVAEKAAKVGIKLDGEIEQHESSLEEAPAKPATT